MICPICKRPSDSDKDFEFHHLEPGAKRRKTEEKVKICHQCADQIHLLFTNTELRNSHNTLDSLVNNEKMQNYVNWIHNKPMTSHFTVAAKKRR